MKDEVQLEEKEKIEDPKDIDLEEVLYADDGQEQADNEVPRETVQYEVYRPRKRRRRREHRLWVRLLKKTCIFLGTAGILAVIILVGFRLNNVSIEGNEYYSDEEILQFINYNSSPKNTLYLYWKNRKPVTEGIPFINKISVSIQNPGTLKVEVTEKIIVGCVEDNGTYMFFDNEGNVVESSTSQREGIPIVSGFVMNGAVSLNMKLPFEDESLLEDLLKLTLALQQYDVEADAVTYSQAEGFSFKKGTVTVRVGLCRDLEDKLTAYNDLKSQPELSGGILHLEDYNATKDSIFFSKDSK